MTNVKEQHCVELYLKRVNKAKRDSLKETGKEIEDSWEWIEEEGGFTAEEVAGHYLSTYRDKALETWLDNLKHAREKHDTDESVTKILKELVD